MLVYNTKCAIRDGFRRDSHIFVNTSLLHVVTREGEMFNGDTPKYTIVAYVHSDISHIFHFLNLCVYILYGMYLLLHEIELINKFRHAVALK